MLWRLAKFGPGPRLITYLFYFILKERLTVWWNIEWLCDGSRRWGRRLHLPGGATGGRRELGRGTTARRYQHGRATLLLLDLCKSIIRNDQSTTIYFTKLEQSDKCDRYGSGIWRTDGTLFARARSKLSQNTEERACRTGAPTRAPTPICTPLKKSPPSTITKNSLHCRTSVDLSL